MSLSLVRLDSGRRKIIEVNNSPKGSFGANKKKVEFLLLSPDSRKLLTTSLNPM